MPKNKIFLFSLLIISILFVAGCAKDRCKDINCNDNNLCTVDTCKSDVGQCKNIQKTCLTGYSCNKQTGNCELIDKCKNVNCDDGNKCTDDSCDSKIGSCIHKLQTCPTGRSCDIKTGICLQNTQLDKIESAISEKIICIPKTCSQLGKGCGSWSDACGKMLDCGGCSSDQTCSNGNCITTATITSSNPMDKIETAIQNKLK